MKPLVFATFSKDVLEEKLQEHEVNNLKKSAVSVVFIIALSSFCR